MDRGTLKQVLTSLFRHLLNTKHHKLEGVCGMLMFTPILSSQDSSPLYFSHVPFSALPARFTTLASCGQPSSRSGAPKPSDCKILIKMTGLQMPCSLAVAGSFLGSCHLITATNMNIVAQRISLLFPTLTCGFFVFGAVSAPSFLPPALLPQQQIINPHYSDTLSLTTLPQLTSLITQFLTQSLNTHTHITLRGSVLGIC